MLGYFEGNAVFFTIVTIPTMEFSFMFAVLYFFLVCDGFLLDDRTKQATTSGPILTDENYNALFNLIIHERQSRAKLEQHLLRLEQELLVTQQGVTDIFHASADNNVTLKHQAKNWNTLRIEYNDLKNDHTLLKLKFQVLSTNHSSLENYTRLLEQKVESLQYSQGVIDLQTIQNARKETQILREQFKKNYKQFTY